MRKIFALLVCVALIYSCDGSGTNNSECNKECGIKASAGAVRITAAEFAVKVADINREWKYLGDKPAIVDFYADWCPPCRMIAPVLDEIAKEYSDIYVYKVNIDACPDIAKVYNVVSIPTLLFIPMSGEPVREVGFLTKGRIENIIKEQLLK